MVGLDSAERMLRSLLQRRGSRGSFGERRVRLDPARPSPAPTSFDDPISGLRVATSLAPRQLGRHQTLFCPANRRERVGGGGGQRVEGGLWLWSAVLPGARYAGSGSPTGRPGGGGGGA